MQLKRDFLVMLLSLMLGLVLSSCSTEKRKDAALYNVDSLLATQIDYLLAHQASITKRAALNSTEKMSTAIPKTVDEWKKELTVFSELDMINKPINKGAYQVENYPDVKSNLSVRSFKTTNDLSVKYLRIYYQHALNKVRKIEAQYDEANALYSSTRFLTMEFRDFFGKTQLTSYSIEGGQKMFLDDSVSYHVDVSISVKN